MKLPLSLERNGGVPADVFCDTGSLSCTFYGVLENYQGTIFQTARIIDTRIVGSKGVSQNSKMSSIVRRLEMCPVYNFINSY